MNSPDFQLGARGLFEGFGVELEYMIVDQHLNVLPIADQLLSAALGRPIDAADCEGEVERGAARWSNELVRHVVELKTNGPADSLEGLASMFQQQVADVQTLLAPFQARLLPTAMHPWMDPDQEMELWPHDYREVYEAFDRVFDCRGHGWANLQSVHLNLPFADEVEFGRLHAAIRLVLPLLPALSASSPFCDGRRQAHLDHRLHVYMGNARRIPSITGEVIPEPVFTFDEYQSRILDRMYRDVAPQDPDGVLRHEWLNARGAIAKFSRQTIEIRLLDVQESPTADLAICALVVDLLRDLVAERFSDLRSQQAFPTDRLALLLKRAAVTAEETPIEDLELLSLLGLAQLGQAPRDAEPTLGDFWKERYRLTGGSGIPSELRPPAELILREGPLARRMLRWVGNDVSRAGLEKLFAQLADCLARGELLRAQ